MNDLRPETRALLAAARGAESLGPQHRDRIKRGVLAHVAVVGASAAVAGSATAMSLATKLTLVVSSVAVLGGGAVSVSVWQHRRAASESKIPATAPARRAQVAATAATPAAEEAATPPTLPAPARREAPRYVPRRPSAVTGPAAPAAPVGPLDPELHVLREAQDDLRAGLPAQALRRLQDFERRFGSGALGQERQAIAAIALCQARPGPAAQARAEAFLRSAPESPLAARVRSACDERSVRDEPSNENPRPREP